MLLDLDFDVSTTNLQPVAVTPELQLAVEQFVYLEARLLDERRFDEWLALWTADGMYWMPRKPEQASPYDHISLMWEDAMLREVRVKRLTNPNNWSQQPPTRSARLVGNVMIDGRTAAGELVVRAGFQLTEWRSSQQQMAGSVVFKLKDLVAGSAPGDQNSPTAVTAMATSPPPAAASTHGTAGRFALHMKRVTLVNSDDVLPIIEVFV
ncbi:MAG: aromatic-ring-hydroxylating dioxygenase [Rhizobacter sp.]|nr:aromatic-ring-hydroxylating dioxygenase [Rhizobacter sp.]